MSVQSADSAESPSEYELEYEIPAMSRRDLFGLAAVGAVVWLARRDFSRRQDRVENLADDYESYATRAYGALQDRFIVRRGGRDGLYYKKLPRDHEEFASNWDFAQAMAATLDMMTFRPEEPSYQQAWQQTLDGLNFYWDRNPPFGLPAYHAEVLASKITRRKYFDDNAWIGLNLLRGYRLTGDEALLARAQSVYEFILSGEDRTSQHAPGGFYWRQDGPEVGGERGTVSNAPSAELGLRLYELTGEDDPRRDRYIEAALKMYDWTNRYMRDPQTGLYWDHISQDGRLDKRLFSYNQGAMIGANVLLNKNTGDPAYLAAAAAIARASALRNGQPVKLHIGNVHDVENFDLQFHATLFRNLLLLASVTPDIRLQEQIRQVVATNTQRMWPEFVTNHRRLPDLYYAFPLGAQAAIVQSLAQLACKPQSYDLLV